MFIFEKKGDGSATPTNTNKKTYQAPVVYKCCDKTFDSEKGLKIHQTRMHGKRCGLSAEIIHFMTNQVINEK